MTAHSGYQLHKDTGYGPVYETARGEWVVVWPRLKAKGTHFSLAPSRLVRGETALLARLRLNEAVLVLVAVDGVDSGNHSWLAGDRLG